MKILSNDIEKYQNVEIGVTIGNFDGVHCGHHEVLMDFVVECKHRGLKPVVLSFEPHPFVYIKKEKNYLIDSSSKKRNFLKTKYKIDLIELEFNDELQKLNGVDFFKQLKNKLPCIKLLYAGYDFGLGKNKEFDFNNAKKSLTWIEVIQGKESRDENNKISSSRIRSLLKKGEIRHANKLLGHPFKISATVTNGNKMGRTLGFATANLSFDSTQILPLLGVYFCRVTHNDKKYKGVVNVGKRPTITNDKETVVEVHLLEFNESIYGEWIDVEFFKRIRDEVKFETKEDLIKQINIDVLSCEKSFYYKKMGLVGKDIQHSKSPDLYKNLLNNQFLNYKLFDVDFGDDIKVEKMLDEAPCLSITSPYKRYFYEKMDILVSVPKELTSVNTVKRVNGKLYGTSTDYFAINDIIENLLSEEFEKIYVLGSGEMFKIIKLIFNMKNINFISLSRKEENLDKHSLIKSKKTLMINATAREFSLDLNTEFDGVLWDLNYNQPYREYLNKIKKLKYIDGEELLLRQAKYALSFWNLDSP